jgi:thioredoxin 2
MTEPVIRKCGSCGAPNRIPAKHLADAGRCGSCKQPLQPLDEPLDADAALFDDVIHHAGVPVLVDFWAAWCGPCRMAAPEVKALAREMAGHALVLKVDTEAHPELAARFHVQGIPTFVVLRNGKVVMQRAGVAPRAEMRRWLEIAQAPAA